MKYLALTVPSEPPINAPPGIPTGSLQTGGTNTIALILDVLIFAVIILSLAYFIYGGYRWMSSAGDPEKRVAARQTLIYAIAGLFLAFCSFIIVNLIGSFFGFNFYQI